MAHGQAFLAFLSLSTLSFLPPLLLYGNFSINVLLVSILVPSLHHMAVSSPFWINYNK